MKKSNFVAMILSTTGGILFALGMCMVLIPEWNSFVPGCVMSVLGAVVLLAMVMIWRKMEGKTPPSPLAQDHRKDPSGHCRRAAAGFGR